MAAKKVDALEEKLEGEVGALKSTIEGRFASMEERFTSLEGMLQKLTELHSRPAAEPASAVAVAGRGEAEQASAVVVAVRGEAESAGNHKGKEVESGQGITALNQGMAREEKLEEGAPAWWLDGASRTRPEIWAGGEVNVVAETGWRPWSNPGRAGLGGNRVGGAWSSLGRAGFGGDSEGGAMVTGMHHGEESGTTDGRAWGGAGWPEVGGQVGR